jgi:glycosyltransferase involved in cell wall biosynthesis
VPFQRGVEGTKGQVFRVFRVFRGYIAVMRVVVDIQAAIAQRAGVGRYTKSLVEHLGALKGPDEVGLFYFDFKGRGAPFPVNGAEQKAVHWFPGRVAQRAWKSLGWPPFNWLAGPADVYHFPNFVRPPLTHGRSVVTVHDVSFLRYPETTETRNLRYLSAQIRKTVELADAVITDSAFSAQEVQELLNVAPTKTRPIHLGLNATMVRPDDLTVVAVRRHLRLERPYLLMVGTLEPRKNIVFLVEIFEQLRGFDGDLVIAGMRGWKYKPILDRMKTSTRAERIRYLDYVDEELLPSLYAGAEALVYPSLYEGFGLPPLEAMACGTPVLSSRAGSLPEVLGEAAEYAGDFDVGAWVGAVSRVLADSALRRDASAKGLIQAAKYTWEETARQTWAVYRRVGA